MIAGAHGGAGVSTLAALLRLEFAGAPAGRGPRIGEMPPVPDADPARIAAAGWLPVPPRGTPLIIVARGTAEGARRAVIAVTALERRGIRPVAVAVIADGAGPEPRRAAQRFGLLDGRAGPLIRVPFAAALRAGADPAAARLPRRLYGRRELPRCAGRGRAGEEQMTMLAACCRSTSRPCRGRARGRGFLTPAPLQVPGLAGPLNTIIGWGKWLVIYLGVIGLLICARRWRSAGGTGIRSRLTARPGIPWVLGGVSLAVIAAGVIGVFLHP